MADVPDEITMIILSNLPVKSLLRFKCISKQWGSWISCPKFQLSNQSQSGVIVDVLFCYKAPCSTTGKMNKRSIRFINQQLASEEFSYPPMKRGRKQDCGLLGSCHGLILINSDEHIYLWNPATRVCTKVLELDDLDEAGYWTRGGLCFDSSKNVYKAVLIMYKNQDYSVEFVIVASLEDKQWRQLEFPYDIPSMSEGITMLGRLHYRVWGNDGSKLIYFDPISEKFHMFPVPEPKSNQEEIVIVGLGVLNECLCIMTCLEHDKSAEILVMKEYGVKESWTSLFSIRNSEVKGSIADINYPYGFVILLFFVTENGELVLIYDYCGKDVAVYNPKNDNMREIVEEETRFILGAIVTYVESLISPVEYCWSEERHRMIENKWLLG
ncbi:F-box/kelch-repeat protein At3g23880-like [Lycium ferocissimum]|uniref:F-box/kelch-repeat protein At3g23880-like n=1 Tax=Lycium ferocissimum TaxID=112874 RepID=UPI0028161B2C|nr:F-box/kelch-repeat protein At3g23880-like [Lycium ferocissimum]